MNPLNHVAIIMDGNGRWGLKYKNSRNLGHKEGINRIEEIIGTCLELKIKYLTLYVFSTENWKRPSEEKNYLFNLIEKSIIKKIKLLEQKKIKILILGKKIFNKKINKILFNVENLTKNNSSLQINLALNYGSRQEIVETLKKIIKKKLYINEKNIIENLYTKKIPDPDILIRTGNTKRLSNFLLWQLSYTEIYFEKKLWPDFKKEDFLRIIKKYKKIKRNYGSV